MGGDSDGSPDGHAFAEMIAELRADGGDVLLVGREPTAHASVCPRLLGDRRRTLVVRTGDPTLRPVGHPDGVEVVEYGDGDDPLGSLGTAVVGAIDDLEAAADGFDPGQFRLCVDSVAPLLENHSLENVFRLLHVLTVRVGAAGGIGHYHLPRERGHEAVGPLETLFDAVVELRIGEEGVEQRWELRDRDVESGWVNV